jgi:transcription antitermination factor NusG
MEAILLEEKQEQEAADKAFQQKQLAAKRPPPSKRLKHAYLLPGVSIRVLSGPFADYTGSLKQLNLKKKKVFSFLYIYIYIPTDQNCISLTLNLEDIWNS